MSPESDSRGHGARQGALGIAQEDDGPSQRLGSASDLHQHRLCAQMAVLLRDCVSGCAAWLLVDRSGRELLVTNKSARLTSCFGAAESGRSMECSCWHSTMQRCCSATTSGAFMIDDRHKERGLDDDSSQTPKDAWLRSCIGNGSPSSARRSARSPTRRARKCPLPDRREGTLTRGHQTPR